MSPLRRITAGVAAAALAMLSVVITSTERAEASSQEVPGQYIAKIYTEAIGRLPYQSEWKQAADRFAESGCNVQSLAEVGQQVYSSADYARLGYDNVSRLMTLFRGVWNSEPEPTELGALQSDLDHGGSWSTVVAKFFVDDRFTSLVPKICSGATDASATSYALAGQRPMQLPGESAGFSGSQSELQAILNDTPAGSTVQLGQRSLVLLTEPLRIPKGVTLTTTGEPKTEQYTQMGRLVRAGDFDAPMVELADGAKLTAVWVDGARNSPGNSAPSRQNIRVLGGHGTAVVGNKISNTAGSASVQVLGRSAGYQCSDVTVSDNVITAYSNDHYLTRHLPDGSSTGTWSDGISVNCADTTVDGNQIVDTGGVGIVVYRSTEKPHDDERQHSKITDNTILSAGVPMYAGIVADPQYYVAGNGEQGHYDFRGTKIAGNRLWSGPTTHFVIGIGVGTRAWYAGSAMTGANTGEGVAVTDNGTGPLGARVRTGIAISGMTDVKLGENATRWHHRDVPGKAGNPCPAVDVAVSESTGTGSVDTDEDYTDIGFDGCVR